MAKDIHAITQRSGDDHFVLLFDDRNRQEIIDQIEAWTIDPDSPLTTEQATRMIRAIRAAPRFERSCESDLGVFRVHGPLLKW